MITEKDKRLIEDYLHGELSKEDIRITRDMYHYDPEFRKEMNLRMSVHEAINEQDSASFSKFISEIFGKHYRRDKRMVRFNFILICLSVLVISFSSFGLLNDKFMGIGFCTLILSLFYWGIFKKNVRL